jgi:thymidylate synthase
MKNNLDQQYANLVHDVLLTGTKKEDRTGTGTLSVFGRQIRHQMSEGFPILTTKRVHFKSVVSELLWFLQGRTDLRWLLQRGNTIWVGDAYKNFTTQISKKHSKHYEPISREEFVDRIKKDDAFADEWGDFGPIYGKQWRSWRNYNYIVEGGEVFNDLQRGFNISREDIEREFLYVDQIQNLIRDLKTNPDSRRLMVSAWNPGATEEMLLPPCHYGFQVWTRELSPKERYDIWFVNNYESGMERHFDPAKLPDFDNPYYTPTPTRAISLAFNMRSVDVPLGLPFNLASYGLLLEILARMVNMVPEELVANLGDTHIYLNQIEGVSEQLNRDSYKLPRLKVAETADFTGTIDHLLNSCDETSFTLTNYKSHPSIKIPLSN